MYSIINQAFPPPKISNCVVEEICILLIRKKGLNPPNDFGMETI